MVSPCVHCDSYILPLSDPVQIEQARSIIARGGVSGPGMGAMVLAQIDAGADGINRNLLAPGEPLWSWHVTEFTEFAEGTVEILDGTPSGVENDVAGWIAHANGAIGFWTYTVVQELPEPSGPVLFSGGWILLVCSRLLWTNASRSLKRTNRGDVRRLFDLG